MLFRTLLRSQKTQLSCFQAIPNSFAKTPGVGGACTREVPKSAPYAILEGQVKRFHFLALVLALAATEATAQTTVANFDSPACSGKAIGVYQGIDFTLSPWDCENPGLAGQTGTSISWYRRTFSGQFKLQTPGTLLSLSAATSMTV